MTQTQGYSVVYKAQRGDSYTSTYRFTADYGRSLDQALVDAEAFCRAIVADGGVAAIPVRF